MTTRENDGAPIRTRDFVPAVDAGKTACALMQKPALWIVTVAAIAIIVLRLRVAIPVGSNYWDLLAYIDASWRIDNGQMPNVDFLPPVGPLGYYLYHWVHRLFPSGHPLLVAQWSLLIVTLPAFHAVLADYARRTCALAFALFTPFAVFSLAPINASSYLDFTGFDAFGIYNRQTALLLYVLVASVLLMRPGWRQSLNIAVLLGALCLVKITGFVVALPVVMLGVLTGRIALRPLAGAGILMAVPLLVVEWHSGIILAYIGDLRTLLALNTSTLISRLAPVVVTEFDNVALILAFTGIIAFVERKVIRRSARRLTGSQFLDGFLRLVDTHAFWLILLLLSAILFESQNTGSLQFLMVWPALVWILGDVRRHDVRVIFTASLFAAVIAVPVFITAFHRSARTVAAAFTFRTISETRGSPLGASSARSDLIARARVMNEHYARAAKAFEWLSAHGEAPSTVLSAEPDFQMAWLISTAQAAQALRERSRRTARPVNSVFVLDFADPFNVLLQTRPPRDVPIIIDPYRTLPSPDEKVLRVLADVDAIVEPRCPVTPVRQAIRAAYAKALEGRTRIELTGCWVLYERAGAASGG